MSLSSAAAAILLGALITLGLRSAPFLVFSKRHMPEKLVRLGNLLPSAIMAVLLDSVYLRSSQNSQPNSDASDMNSGKERGRVFRIACSDPSPAF